ncbi:MAG: GNAT family N-acetyltransferase [Anaerolineales bacterium]|jgi:mycothiol synthase
MNEYFNDLLNQGMTVRPGRMEDLPSAVAMFNRSSQKIIGRDEFSLERYQHEWNHPNFDLDLSTRVVLSPQGDVIGCIEVWDTNPNPIHPWVWARVDPAWEGKGIGTAMMRWAIDRAHQAIEQVPAEARVSIYCGANRANDAAQQLFADLGLSAIRYSWTMLIAFDQEPPEPQWPEGIELRTYHHPDQARDVYDVIRNAFRDHWGYIEVPFEDGFERWQHFALAEEMYFDPDLWFLAMDGDKIAGISLCAPRTDDDPDRGWVNTLGVLKPYRRRGVALALLQHSFDAFYRMGKQRAGLGVDGQNLTGATRLYEKAGMHIELQEDTYELELRPGEELSNRG